MPERKLILVKHARPEILPDAPPNRWRLSTEGRRDCAILAERLKEHAPEIIVSSGEPKAVETAEIVAGRPGVEHLVQPGLHEHDRTGAPFGTEEEFRRSVKNFFDNPAELVWGNETADRAEDRFARTINDVLEKHREGNVAVVAHGTVISLFIARHNDIEPFGLWRELGLPAFCVLSVPGFGLREIVGSVAWPTARRDG